jgi:hypothetical protein
VDWEFSIEGYGPQVMMDARTNQFAIVFRRVDRTGAYPAVHMKQSRIGLTAGDAMLLLAQLSALQKAKNLPVPAIPDTPLFVPPRRDQN